MNDREFMNKMNMELELIIYEYIENRINYKYDGEFTEDNVDDVAEYICDIVRNVACDVQLDNEG